MKDLTVAEAQMLYQQEVINQQMADALGIVGMRALGGGRTALISARSSKVNTVNLKTTKITSKQSTTTTTVSTKKEKNPSQPAAQPTKPEAGGKNTVNAGCNCFTAGTKVLTDAGEKPIEEIEVGDKVLSKDEETGEQAYKEVTALHRNEKVTTYKLSVGNQIIETTDNHPFWVDGKGWVLAIDLKVGNELVQSNGNHLTIDNIEIVHHDEKVKVYNFTVADFHTYFVSSLGVWVHNIECLPTVSFTTKKLQHEWKHAGDFGLSGNWNKANGKLYEKAIQNHMQGATNVWKSKYRGDDVYVYYDKNTGIGSYTDLSGNYVGGWKFNQAQLEFHQKNGQALFTN